MIWLIGAGGMSAEYAKILKNMQLDFKVIGNREQSAKIFEANLDIPVIRGGLENFVNSTTHIPDSAIVSVSAEHLIDVTKLLISHGVKDVLVEKPAGLSLSDLNDIKMLSAEFGARLYVAYNRRFYSSVQKLVSLCESDGGILSCDFEFTEWSHVISKLNKPPCVLDKWLICNSTHVIDLAFFICGIPKSIECFTSGGVDWHPVSSVFAGAGITEQNILFSYSANWESAGRWSVSVKTKMNKYILEPMERLFVQKKGQIAIEEIAIDDSLDMEFKPGLYKQVESFVNGSKDCLCDLEQHIRAFPIYEKIAGYR